MKSYPDHLIRVTFFYSFLEGEVTFRYSIFRHNAFNESDATKRGIEMNQPLIVSAAGENSAGLKSLFTIENKSIILSTINHQ
jgi:hypothetical protein